MMRVMVGTPCGGGVATVQYMLSMLDSFSQCQLHKQEIARQIIQQSPGFNHGNPVHLQGLQAALHKHSYELMLYTLAGESLVQRGRNHIAQQALAHGVDKLMFIDADTGWTWDQLKTILDSPHPIIAGLVPLKIYPISLNYLPFAEDENHFQGAVRGLDGTRKLAESRGSNVFKVPFVGTAFMCIDTKVLIKMAETTDHYFYPNPVNGEPLSHWDFFHVGSIVDTFLSEDWSFCDKARKLGFDVHVDSSVLLNHTGNHTFRVA